ncbi:MAG: TraB/GumN family protein [Pseudomonadales bacterium]|nr:TraB/GumN family protein [Pseudomonadales bacterium]
MARLTGKTLSLLFFAWLTVGAGAQSFAADSHYLNEAMGVRLTLDDDWQLITSREQAPEPLKANFPLNKGPNDSPLFFAVHENQQLFIRLLADPFGGDLRNYAVLLSRSLDSQGIEILSARLADDASALEMQYRHPLLRLYFDERIVQLETGRVVRMAFWSNELSRESFLPQVEAVFAATELRAVRNMAEGWQQPWAGLSDRLAAQDLNGVNITGTEVATAHALVCQDPGRSMLWQAQSKEATVYLFGSIHVGKPEFYPLHDSIETAFREADHLVFEVDPASVTDPTVVRQMQDRGSLPAGQTLSDVVSAPVVANFRRVMARMGLPAENFMGMQPWFLTLMLTGLQANMEGYQPQFGVENYLLGQKSADTDVLELESIQEQIAFLEELNAETFLRYTLQDFAGGGEELNAMMAAWQCADQEALAALMFDDFDEPSIDPAALDDLRGLREKLFYERNLNMAATVQRYLEAGSGRYFVVVGSGHLLGERSVIDVLRQRGYQLRSVSLR